MRMRPGVAAAAALLALAPGGGAGAETHADFMLTGGTVYTLDAARTWARAVAVRGGRILYVGTDAGAKGFAGPSTRVLDLEGKMVLPGFHDAHVHYARQHPEEPWIWAAAGTCRSFRTPIPRGRSSTGSRRTDPPI